jgi:hypothetical protein
MLSPTRTPDRARRGGLHLAMIDASMDALLCSPTGSMGGAAGFLGSPLPQIPLFQPSPRRAGLGPETGLGPGFAAAADSPARPAPSMSGLSSLFASPLPPGAAGGGRAAAAAYEAAALQFAAELLATPCSKRADTGGPAPGSLLGAPAPYPGSLQDPDLLESFMASPPTRRAPGVRAAAGVPGGGRGPQGAASLDALLDLVGAPPGVAAAAAAAVAGTGAGSGVGVSCRGVGAAGPMSPAPCAVLSAGELDLLALLQTPGSEVRRGWGGGGGAPPRGQED